MPYINAKIYSDGGHYIAIPKENFPSEQRRRKKYKSKQLEIKTDGTQPPTPKEKFETAYAESQKLPKRERKKFIADKLKDDFKSKEETAAFIESNIERKKTNAVKRYSRLWKKVNLQRWDYFVTFTYDSALHDEVKCPCVSVSSPLVERQNKKSNLKGV